VIVDMSAFLGWFDGVNRRTMRDVSLLPAEAETWVPPGVGDDEGSWGIPKLVQHIAEARPYFASGFQGRGWVWDPWPTELRDRATWIPALEESALQLRRELEGVPNDSLVRKVELIGAPDRPVSAWRLLMMLAEHEIHHRSQMATYAGLNGWEVAQVFGRDNEWVVAQRDDQVQRYR
jgi:uncharacterized damage-inducible protein DinB